jgi:signal peptidase I
MPQSLPEERRSTLAFEDLACCLSSQGIGFRFQARGGSMNPTIRDGDILHVQPPEGVRLRRGDIILFQHKGQIKAHRIIGRKKEAFIACGDANRDRDDQVFRQQILGLVTAKEHPSAHDLIPLNTALQRLHWFARRCYGHALNWLKRWRLSSLSQSK